MQIRNSVEGVYDPKEVILLIGGEEVTGVVDGTFVSLSKDVDVTSHRVGADGSVGLALRRNNAGTMTVSLKNTSPSNRIILNYLRQGRESEGAIIPLAFTDPSSGVSFESEGWVMTQADFNAAEEVEQTDWVFGVADILYRPSQTTQNAFGQIFARRTQF